MNLLVATMLTVKLRSVPLTRFAVVLAGTLAVLWKLGTCETYTDLSDSDASFCVCDAPRVSLEVQIWTDLNSEDTPWKVVESKGNTLGTGGPYCGAWEKYTHVVSGFCPSNCFEFTIFDAYGDGLCCDYGKGGYVVKFDGEVVHIGHESGSSETFQFGNCS